MEFDIRLVGNRFPTGIDQSYYKSLLRLVSSHNNEDSIPGRELRMMVNERRSNKVVGFIRLQSPLINSKPRNNLVGKGTGFNFVQSSCSDGFCNSSITTFWI